MSDIVSQLKKQILEFDEMATNQKSGEVAEIADGVARIYGLKDAKLGELLQIITKTEKIPAMALSLEEGVVGAIVLGEFSNISAGDKVEPTGKTANIACSQKLVGRVIDPLGNPIDNKGNIEIEKFMNIERIAPGVIERESVKEPLQTGIKAIDAMIPIGRGQRELIIGDRGTGKTAIAIDTVINQRRFATDKRPICIYVSIGQKKSKIAKLVATLEEEKAMDYTIVVAATASDPASLNYIAPYCATAIAEFFMEKGKDVLIVYDDLTKQAWAYREISLILRRPPGREAYPGDVFYLHSRLLERAAKLSDKNGGGSITALPIIETQAGDISAYIPTNVISITDGQIYLEPDLFYKGIRPAINIGLSVSRVGGSAQIKAMKKVAGKLKLDLAQFRELESFAQFGSDLDEKTKMQIERGKRLTELMKQKQLSPMATEEEVILIYAAVEGLFDRVGLDKMEDAQQAVLTAIRTQAKDILKKISSEGDFDDKDGKEVLEIIKTILRDFETQKKQEDNKER